MKGTFTTTGTPFVSTVPPRDYSTGFVRGGQGKSGLLKLDFGTGTVQLLVSTDEGATWGLVGSYTTDQCLLVHFPSAEAVYTLNCTVHSVNIAYSMGE